MIGRRQPAPQSNDGKVPSLLPVFREHHARVGPRSLSGPCEDLVHLVCVQQAPRLDDRSLASVHLYSIAGRAVENAHVAGVDKMGLHAAPSVRVVGPCTRT